MTVGELVTVASGDIRVPAHIEIRSADQNPARVYVGRLRGEGARTMRGALQKVAALLAGTDDAVWDLFPWEQLRYPHVVTVRRTLAERYAPAYANKILSAVRGVLGECWKLGLIDVEAYQRAIGVDPVRGSSHRKGRYIERTERRLLFSRLDGDDSTKAARDRAILGVLFGSGLRRAEVVALRLEDYREPDRALRVRGKGNKARMAYLGADADAYVRQWIATRGREAGALFVPVHRSGRLRIRHLSEQALYRMLNARVADAGLGLATPHDCRRTFATDLLHAGEDLITVKEMLGHSKVETTATYDHRGEGRKRRAANRIELLGGRSADL